MSLAALELDLDVFSGPFDLLLTLVLREEVDLLELQLADVVLAYLDHLEARGELDLETATEFIVLIAALLELKSRLMLLGEEEELLDIEPEQAAEELLARMLDARRYRAAAGHLGELLAGEHGVRFRAAPLPAAPAPHDRSRRADGSQDPSVLGAAIGRLLAMPPSINLRHIARAARHRRRAPRAPARAAARAARFSFDEAVRGADRMTVAVTLFALLELYKRGEAGWEQQESFGEIPCSALAGAGARRRSPPALAASGRARLAGGDRAGDARAGAGRGERAARTRAARARTHRRGAAVPLGRPAQRRPSSPRRREAGEGAIRGGARAARRAVRARARGIVLRELGGGWTLASDPASEDAARRLFSRPRLATLTPGAGRDARDRRLPAAGLAAGDRPHPRRQRRLGGRDAARPRPDRGGRALAVRRGPVPHDDAVPEAVRAAHARGAARHRAAGTRRPRSRPSCASGCCAPARRRAGRLDRRFAGGDRG